MQLIYNKPKSINLWNAYEDFDSLFSIPTLFPTSRSRAKSIVSVDVIETEKGYIVKADIPGFNKEDVEVTLDNELLTIKGEKKQEEAKEGSTYLIKERSYSSFEKSIVIDKEVSMENAKAVIKDGVLELTLPKKEAKKTESKKINID